METPSSKVELRRLRLNQGGYTDSGQYYGTGQPLYEYRLELPDAWDCNHHWQCSQDGPIIQGDYPRCGECERPARLRRNDVCEIIRAYSREHAKQVIRRIYPQATFYR